MTGLLVSLAALWVLLAAVWVALWPLFVARGASPSDAEVERRELEAEKARLLQEIHELELDYQTGKLSDEDHATIEARLKGKAVEVMQRLDALSALSRDPDPLPSSHSEVRMHTTLTSIALCLLAGDLLAQAPTPARTFEVDYATTLIDLRFYQDMPVGATFTVICPSEGPIQPIWGTDTYTSDSSICLAAIHAGALVDDRAVVEVAPGLDAYVGTARNGLASQSYPAWNSSFRFPRAGTSSVGFLHHAEGDWTSRPDQGTAPVGARVRFECAADGSGGPIWGTGIYTQDSSICEAAVHAGMITRARGGTVIFELLGAQPSFRGSVQNGVSSSSYGPWPRSFRFIPLDE